MTDHDAQDPNGQPEIASHLNNEATAALDAAVMQDMQLSLVDRIADVDDERRRSSTQLRKALQTHKDELERRLVGYRRALIGLSALTALLTVGMIGFGVALYAQRGEVARQIANIDALASPSDETSAATNQLATQVADIDLRLARLASQLGDVEPATRSDSVGVLSGQIEGMEAIAAVAESPMPSPAYPPTPDQSAAADLDEPMLDQAPGPSPDQATEQAFDRGPDRIGLQADAADVKVEQRRLEAQIAAARNEHIGSQQSGTLPVDQLIDDQLERLEREYQRLARQVDAPAVQPAGPQPFAGAGLASGAQLALSADATTSAPNDSSIDDSDGMTTQQPWIALQLIGLRSRDEVRAFIAEHNLPEPLYLRSETYRGRPWYALIRSLHEDMESAATARDALPGDLAQLDIWLRELPAGTELERIGPDAND